MTWTRLVLGGCGATGRSKGILVLKIATKDTETFEPLAGVERKELIAGKKDKILGKVFSSSSFFPFVAFFWPLILCFHFKSFTVNEQAANVRTCAE